MHYLFRTPDDDDDDDGDDTKTRMLGNFVNECHITKPHFTTGSTIRVRVNPTPYLNRWAESARHSTRRSQGCLCCGEGPASSSARASDDPLACQPGTRLPPTSIHEHGTPTWMSMHHPSWTAQMVGCVRRQQGADTTMACPEAHSEHALPATAVYTRVLGLGLLLHFPGLTVAALGPRRHGVLQGQAAGAGGAAPDPRPYTLDPATLVVYCRVGTRPRP